jgi:hypothetical protein
MIAKDAGDRKYQSSIGNGLSCETDSVLLDGSSTSCRQARGGWPGLIPSLLETDPDSKVNRAEKNTFDMAMDSCLAPYVWQD